jgi:hypothetical protein
MAIDPSSENVNKCRFMLNSATVLLNQKPDSICPEDVTLLQEVRGEFNRQLRQIEDKLYDDILALLPPSLHFDSSQSSTATSAATTTVLAPQATSHDALAYQPANLYRK